MKRSIALGCALVALVATATPAAAAKAPKVTTWGTSFLDKNNDGVMNGDDVLLGTALAQFNNNIVHTSHASGASPWGVVVSGNVTIYEREPNILMMLDGNVRMSGTLKVVNDGGIFQVATVNGDAEIVSGTTLTTKGDFSLTASAGTLSIGNKATISGFDVRLDGGTTVVGTNEHFSVSDHDYHDFVLNSSGAMTIGNGLAFKGPGHTYFDIHSGTTLRIDAMKVTSGYMFFTSRTAQPGSIYLSNTTLNQTYKNGAMELRAAEGAAGGLWFHNVTWSSAGGDARFFPPPTEV